MWEVGNWVVPGAAGVRDGRSSVRSNPQRRKGRIRRGDESLHHFALNIMVLLVHDHLQSDTTK